MPKYPSFKPREMEKLLLKNGFVVKRQSGSHRVFFNSKLDKTTIVPIHSKSIPQGTIRSIVKQTGLPEKVFLKKKSITPFLLSLQYHDSEYKLRPKGRGFKHFHNFGIL